MWISSRDLCLWAANGGSAVRARLTGSLHPETTKLAGDHGTIVVSREFRGDPAKRTRAQEEEAGVGRSKTAPPPPGSRTYFVYWMTCG